MPPLSIASQKQRAPFPRRFIAIITLLLISACFVIAQLWAVNIISSANHHGLALDRNLRLSSHDHNLRVVKRRNTTLAYPSSPACHPHLKIATSDKNGTTWRTSLPFTRIYFYHVRKAGGTMLRKFLKKVAQTHNIHLHIQENKYAREEVGSHPGTMYVTNLRDPVERSISHFKYEGRWNCRQMIKDASHYTPTLQNARKFEQWNSTGGFKPSPCDESFSFHECAVNCYIQSFSGQGCTRDEWKTQYALAQERLFRYNLIFVYEKFKDPKYVEAIEQYFGVEQGSFNQESNYWCGPEAKEANKLYPLTTKFEVIVKHCQA